LAKRKNARKTLTSKWTKTIVLLKNSKLRTYVPETKLFDKSSVLLLLKKYRMVYVKPINGSFGNGVIRVQRKRTNNGYTYEYQHGTVSRSFTNYDALFSSLSRSKLKRRYLVQKGIRLLKFNKRVLDVRIMVQKNTKRKWEATGYIGRVAHPKKIVTNFHNSGKPLPLEVLLKHRVNGEQRRKYIGGLKKLGCQIALHLNRYYPGFSEIGVDLGIDTGLKPWILEVNTAPDPFIFNQLRDKRMFNKVIHYARSNGRFRKK
jgi:glutathione synthase/RimK-type ligase-like ATP-grasp enzyme